jgi:hypothetical protein
MRLQGGHGAPGRSSTPKPTIRSDQSQSAPSSDSPTTYMAAAKAEWSPAVAKPATMRVYVTFLAGAGEDQLEGVVGLAKQGPWQGRVSAPAGGRRAARRAGGAPLDTRLAGLHGRARVPAASGEPEPVRRGVRRRHQLLQAPHLGGTVLNY